MTLDKNSATIVRKEVFDTDEAEKAKDYWSSIEFENYKREKPWSRFMAESILRFEPRSVFEFGCNAGKNLSTLRAATPHVSVHGVDINANAISYAQSIGLNAEVSDETYLERQIDNRFDVSFTVSVLDHLPDPGPALRQLGRISKTAVLLLEPWLNQEGKVVKNFNNHMQKTIDTTPFSYSWNYIKMGQEYLPGWNCQVIPFPMKSNLGPYYELYVFTQ